jgi:hypothetical protein
MLFRIGDRLTDETGEYEITGRPYTTNAGKDVHARVKRIDNVEITMIRTWGAHERISVKRAGEGKDESTASSFGDRRVLSARLGHVGFCRRRVVAVGRDVRDRIRIRYEGGLRTYTR